MTSYSRARSLSASVRRAWSGSRLSRSLRTGRTTETPSGSATARALLIGGLAAHDVAEGKPAERDALDARDAQAGWNQREQPGEIEGVQVPLVVHALRHLIVAGALAQQDAVQPALSEHRLERVDQPLVRHRDDRDASARDDPVHLRESGGRGGEGLEHLRAVDALPRPIPEWPGLGVALPQ